MFISAAERKKSICNRLTLDAWRAFCLYELTFTAFLVAELSGVAPGALAGVSLPPGPGHALAPPTLVVTTRIPGPVHHRGVLLGVQRAAGAHLVTVLGRLEEVHKLVVYINFLQTS